MRYARARAFLIQIFATVPREKLVFAVTHEERINAVGEVVGEPGLSFANAQLVPFLITLEGDVGGTIII